MEIQPALFIKIIYVPPQTHDSFLIYFLLKLVVLQYRQATVHSQLILNGLIFTFKQFKFFKREARKRIISFFELHNTIRPLIFFHKSVLIVFS